MRTDERFETDPQLEDALRALYARHESLADVESPWRLLAGAQALDARAQGARSLRRRAGAWALVPLAAAASVIALAAVGSLLDRPSFTTASSSSSASMVHGPGAGSAAGLGKAGDGAADEARREEDRRVKRELEQASQARTEAEERAVVAGGSATASALAQHVLEAYESRRASSPDGSPLHGFSWLQPVLAGTVQDEGHTLSLTAARAEADTASCGMVYGVSAAESAYAVVVAAFAVTPLPRADGSCSPPTESARFVEVPLATPIGDRVIIDAATGALLEPPLIVDEGASDTAP